MDTIAPMHKTIDKVLASLMAEKGISQADLARKTGVNQPTISRILKPNGLKGIKEPTDKQVRPLAEYFGVSTDQLRGYAPIASAATVEDEKTPTSTAEIVSQMLAKHGKSLSDEARQRIMSAADEPPIEAKEGNIITADFSRPGLVGDEISLAHYDVRGAMGGGQVPADYAEMLRDVKVSQQHLRELGVTFSDPNHLKVVTGWGQSMEPTIRHRDPLIVDVSIREFTGDGIYLFARQGHLYIKRLQVQDEDRFEMISDNAKHRTRIIRIDETYIHARVLLVWNAHLL